MSRILIIIIFCILFSINKISLGQVDEIKFYNVNFLIFNNPPAIYKVLVLEDNIKRKLNSSFLYNITSLQAVYPQRLIINKQQFVFLEASYPALHKNIADNPCNDQINSDLIILRYQYGELQPQNKIPLNNCQQNVSVIDDATNGNNLNWDDEKKEFTIKQGKYIPKKVKTMVEPTDSSSDMQDSTSNNQPPNQDKQEDNRKYGSLVVFYNPQSYKFEVNDYE